MIQLTHCSRTIMHRNILRNFDAIWNQRLLIMEDAVKVYLVHFTTWSLFGSSTLITRQVSQVRNDILLV
jgi:hypothetical protein